MNKNKARKVWGIMAIGFLLILPLGCAPRKVIVGSVVKIVGQKGDWTLKVNGEPFYIKGAGCGEPEGRGGEDYLELAKELGANAVRTWGTDQGTEHYFDTALKYGLMVDAGIWLNSVTDTGVFSCITDDKYMEKKKNEIVEYVNRFKDHPALLMWNVGNEAIFFTKDEEERIALSKFLEQMVQLIHQLDANHPVIYTSSDATALPYIKKYVPSLDAFGMNIYGSIRMSHSRWDQTTLNIPYVVTEFGPLGPWDVKKDANGASMDQPDQAKAALYKYMFRNIMDFKGCNLGGFAHHLGETTQESMTWWNLNYKTLKRASFWELYKIYTGNVPSNLPPRITKFNLSKINGIAPGETIDIFVEATDNENDPLNYNFILATAQEGILKYYVNEEIPAKFISEGTNVKLIAPEAEGRYRVYVFVKDGKGNVATSNRSIKVGP
ncbi:MAG: hypothetical protein AMJ78_03520 [Omnitrophica WOR_2 bacterium SM23_29]|nr:MAG: hypothetical protein AMJ78_03520 [Omnitrophica WOR_2 bacterium SM23_29]